MVLAIFIDLRKAFDSVSHSMLFRKFEQIGVRDLELSWFKSYINGRKQRVSVGCSLSDPETLNAGVAEGSLLGILLFQLIINDMFHCLKFSTSILYADDTTLIVSGSSLKFVKSKMQSALNSLQSWLPLNKLKLNVKKTKCMLLHKDGLTSNIHLMVDEQTIELVTSFKFLGIIIDNTLSFNLHFTELHSKLLKATFLIRHLSKLLTFVGLKSLYYA